MSLISQSIKNLKGGISQQPDILRYADQGAAQVNAFSSEVEGLQKRPPSVHVKRINYGGYFGSKPLCHIIHRDETEKYAVFFQYGKINVVDLLTGEEKTVSTPNGVGYIQTTQPREDLRCVTIADYTFIVNRKVVPEASQATTPVPYALGAHGLVALKGGQYAKTFQILINNKQAAVYTTPLGNDIHHATEIDVQYILARLAEQVPQKMGAGWVARKMEGYLWISPPAGQKITSLRVVDGYNGQLMTAIIHDVQRSSDLPVRAPHNYQIRVAGEVSSGQDDYWVQFDGEKGVWKECVAPATPYEFRDWTMPHILVRQADGSFTFKQADWAGRVAGDEDTNPWPSFIGTPLNDIFFYRNRLGLVSSSCGGR